MFNRARCERAVESTVMGYLKILKSSAADSLEYEISFPLLMNL